MSLQPESSVGSQGAQRPSLEQKPTPRASMHSAPSVHARQNVVSVSQIGVVGDVQLAAVQPPHAPEAVQTSAPGQSSGVIEHARHVLVAASQIGVVPEQPA